MDKETILRHALHIYKGTGNKPKGILLHPETFALFELQIKTKYGSPFMGDCKNPTYEGIPFIRSEDYPKDDFQIY